MDDERLPIQAEVESVPEPLGDAELGDLLAAIGNSEAKSLLLIGMHPDYTYSAADLHELFVAMQGDEIGWKPSPEMPFKYCMHSMEPIGMVARGVSEEGRGTVGYRKTERGSTIGEALAGHLLAFSERHPETTLNAIWGQANSSKRTPDGGATEAQRVPLTRLKVFTELLTSDGPIRAIDIEDPGVMSRSLTGTLESLARAGLLTYENRMKPQGYAKYMVESTDLSSVETLRKAPTIFRAVRDLIETSAKKGTELDPQQVTKLIREKDPALTSTAEKNTYTDVTRVLAYLKREGALGLVGGSYHEKSTIEVDDRQYEILAEAANIALSIQRRDQEFIAEGLTLAERFRNDPAAGGELIAKFAADSSRVNEKHRQELRAVMMPLLTREQGATAAEIFEALEVSGKRYHTGTVKGALRSLESSGSLDVVDVTNRTHRYRLQAVTERH